jgi:hypothetical protein
VASQWLSPASAERLVHEANRMCRLNEELTDKELEMEREAVKTKRGVEPTERQVNHLMLSRRSRGGTIFNYRPGDIAFGHKGVPQKDIVAAVANARFPFPPDSCNLRQQYELSKDGNNGFTCSAADFPFLAIARKYEESCFVRATTAPRRFPKRPTYCLVGSKVLKSGRESRGGDDDDSSRPSRLETVQCNSMGEFALEVRGAATAVADNVRFGAKSGHFMTTIRRYQTHQQLHHMDASLTQIEHTCQTGHPFWSCVGSHSHEMRLNVSGFNCRLFAGLSAVQTGTNVHAGSFGYQQPRTHTYLDINFEDGEQLFALGTKLNSDTTLIGFWFDKKQKVQYSIFPYDTDPNQEEQDPIDEDE